MDRSPDPFMKLTHIKVEELEDLLRSTHSLPRISLAAQAPVVGKLHGFNLQEQPLISDIPLYPGHILVARSVVSLKRAMIGREVVVWFDSGDVRMPVIMGIMEPQPLLGEVHSPKPSATVQVDDERYVIQAEREIVLRCGDASITLTRAGKVIIKGNYILSRSTGYNKIKGAAIDIN